MRSVAFCIVSLFLLNPLAQADSSVLVWSIDQDLETTYKNVYNALEENRFYVVFEPNIQRNLSAFAERWGDNYNRNKLQGIRAMVFCNVWYTNEISNADPDMLALCPLHITLIQQEASTRILFVRPSVVAAGSEALAVARELEEDIAKAMQDVVKDLHGSAGQ
jgi:uncharacterized protein (DUF302 family)